MKKLPASTTLKDARKAGRMGDQELVHLNSAEVAMLESMTGGHGLTINPQTGEKEAFLPFLLGMLPTLFPTLGASLAGATGLSALASPLLLGALGSGLGTWAETGDLGKGLMAGVGGAALGGLGGQLFGGAAGSAAGKLAGAVNPAIGMGGTETVKSLLAGNVAKGALTQAAGQAGGQAAAGGLGGMLGNMGGMMPAMLTGAPGAYLSAQDQMNVGETDSAKRKKASIARAQQESFMTPRTLNQAPDGYRHGMDPEFNFFAPGGTLTPVTTRRGYADGGPVSGGHLPRLPGAMWGGTPAQMPGPTQQMTAPPFAQPMTVQSQPVGQPVPVPMQMSAPQTPSPMAMPTPLPSGPAMPQVPAGLGVWGGLQLPPRQMPRVDPSPPPAQPGGSIPGRGSGYPGAGHNRYGVGGFARYGDLEPSIMDHITQSRMFPDLTRTMRFADGGMVMGPGDGRSDSVPAVINGQEPAALSDGEFVVSADVVAALGNGSNKAGAEKLQAMMDAVRASHANA